MGRQAHAWVTAGEVVRLLGTLEPQTPVTIRQLRYFDTTLGIVAPSRAGTGPNAGRLYDAVDVAVVRLALRALAGRGARQTWAALRYLEADLRAALAAGGRGLALSFETGIGELRAAGKAVGGYDLASCLRGVAGAMTQIRRTEGAAWTGNRWIADPAAVVMRPSAARGRL